MPMRPLGDLLDELFKEEVAEEGDGLSLGMSTHMMRFFSMPGPFIGMSVLCGCVGKGRGEEGLIKCPPARDIRLWASVCKQAHVKQTRFMAW